MQKKVEPSGERQLINTFLKFKAFWNSRSGHYRVGNNFRTIKWSINWIEIYIYLDVLKLVKDTKLDVELQSKEEYSQRIIT